MISWLIPALLVAVAAAGSSSSRNGSPRPALPRPRQRDVDEAVGGAEFNSPELKRVFGEVQRLVQEQDELRAEQVSVHNNIDACNRDAIVMAHDLASIRQSAAVAQIWMTLWLILGSACLGVTAGVAQALHTGTARRLAEIVVWPSLIACLGTCTAAVLKGLDYRRNQESQCAYAAVVEKVTTRLNSLVER